MSQRTSLALDALRCSIASIAIAVALTGSIRAQGFCFENEVPALPNTPVRTFAVSDLNGDGLPDVAFTNGVASSVSGGTPASLNVAMNLGDGTFGNPTQLYLATGTIEELPKVLIEDVDGDGDLDLVVLSASYVLGPTGGSVAIWMNDGTGTFTFSGSYAVGQVPYTIVAADIDGDSDVDILCTAQIQAGILVLNNSGTGTFTPTSIPVPCPSCSATFPSPGDVDGDGDVDLVVSTTIGAYLMLNTGLGSFTSSGPLQYGGGSLVDLDGDGDLDLAAVSYNQGYYLTVYLNQGNGTFVSGWTGAFAATGNSTWADVDGDGDLDFVSAAAGVRFLLNQGDATFGMPVSIPGTPNSDVAVADFDGDGDADVLGGGANGLVLYRGCRIAGAAFCAGDGSGAACPCGNSSAAGADAGCSNSLGTAGVLRGNGIARISSDSFTLLGGDMANSGALYFQGTTRVGAGAGAGFGDGLRCAGGTIVRLATKTNVAGTSQFPAAGDPLLSVRGQVTAPGTRTYQVWYRNSATFCTPSTFNLTNGLEVTWGS